MSQQTRNGGQSAWEQLKTECKNGSEPLFLILLGVYLLNHLTEYIAWGFVPVSAAGIVRQGMMYLVLLLLGVYLASVVSLWALKRQPRKTWVILPIIAGIGALICLCASMQRNLFDGWMIAFLALCAYGKDYRKILKLYFFITAAVVALAMAGLPFGLTALTAKDGSYGSGLALGFTHPNVWSYYVFSLAMLAWYLYVPRRSRAARAGYFACCWAMAAFMVSVPKCRTQAVILALFPFAAVLCEKLVETDGRSQEKAGAAKNILRWILILSPILCFALTVFLGAQREWLVEHTFGTYVENFSKRFIQSGLAFGEHGFPFFGEVIRFETAQAENLAGLSIRLYVMDNAYSTYAIYRGMIWMVPALVWLCHANRRMIARRDGAMLAISALLCLVGLMERYPLEIYNFAFLYPLAARLESGGKT